MSDRWQGSVRSQPDVADLRSWLILWNVENFSLQPVTLRQQLFPALPTVPCPPSQFFSECQSRRWGITGRALLKVIPMMPPTVLTESLVLGVV